MLKSAFVTVLLALATLCLAQQNPPSAPSDRSREAGDSSSRDTKIDISPPANDSKKHPDSSSAVSDLTADEDASSSDIQEFHPWDPMKAMKDIEVGDFYFRRHNYRAALDRYKEALYFKDNDAVATFRLAQCQEKLGSKGEAQKYYQQYLDLLPEGPYAKEAHASLTRLAKK